MFTRMSHYDREQLQRMLNGELPEATQTAVVRHLENCTGCQQQMESLAATAHWWEETRDALAGLQPHTNSSEFSGLSMHPAEESIRTVPLDFLAPSDNPAMLGRLGEFEILEEIGCGGMGIVLKGYDHELNRYVAVKVLHPFCATSAAARRRFVREAQAAAAIVHQHVVAIHAVDASHHPPYLVMPYVPGESLQQRLTRVGSLDVVDTLRIGQQVADGLAAAHAQGLVHRDIKPGNILLERNVERVLLTDFGLARAADDASLTRSGVIAGTPQFMSPEQARGDQVDHRTDLFSLGTVLYTMLAGHSPFRSETAMGVLRRVCDETPRPLREINPAVPDWLEALIAKLQAKQIDDRFENAHQVAALLQNCLAHVQQPTRVPLPVEVTDLVRRPAKLREWQSGLVAILLFVVCGAIWALRPPAAVPLPHASVSPPTEAAVLMPTPADDGANDGWDDELQPETEAVLGKLKALENDSEF
ncbi:protein kinase domain-containing protein [Schlesneria sp. DSM 10557]|uniref:serine/threonine-protein kinase n=1 Tax=Schlesneria sp. DSM 10557 TaxID=3044399 RepID=UPI00359F1C8F